MPVNSAERTEARLYKSSTGGERGGEMMTPLTRAETSRRDLATADCRSAVDEVPRVTGDLGYHVTSAPDREGRGPAGPGQPLPREGEKRRSGRSYISLPIVVVGSDINGVCFTEETKTICLSRNGARFILTHAMLPEEVLWIKNLSNGLEDEFRVIGPGQPVFGSRNEWCVEPLHGDTKIWGVPIPSSSAETKALIWIRCAACRTLIQSPLSWSEYCVLLATGMISRDCAVCHETTRWKMDTLGARGEESRSVSAREDTSVDRRKSRRLSLRIPITVVTAERIRVLGNTRNVSKTGVCFSSGHRFRVGEEVQVWLGSVRKAGTIRRMDAEGGVYNCGLEWAEETEGCRLMAVSSEPSARDLEESSAAP